MGAHGVSGLRAASPLELDRIYRSAPRHPGTPTGWMRGEHLAWVDAPGARRKRVRVLDTLAFRWTPWGIDWDACRWTFATRALGVAHFTVEAGPSRWRDTDTLRLRYEVSRLPIRAILYDEVKPLGPDLALGIGGTDAEVGRGDHFYFLLSR
jgi:hypothetical protein